MGYKIQTGVKIQNMRFYHERSSYGKNCSAEIMKNIVPKLSTKEKYFIIP